MLELNPSTLYPKDAQTTTIVYISIRLIASFSHFSQLRCHQLEFHVYGWIGEDVPGEVHYRPDKENDDVQLVLFADASHDDHIGIVTFVAKQLLGDASRGSNIIAHLA